MFINELRRICDADKLKTCALDIDLDNSKGMRAIPVVLQTFLPCFLFLKDVLLQSRNFQLPRIFFQVIYFMYERGNVFTRSKIEFHLLMILQKFKNH